MFKKTALSILLTLHIVGFTNAQVKDSLVKFSPNGKIEGRVFTDFFYEFNEHKTAFEISRAYLGYNYSYTENFSVRTVIDVSKPDVTINGKTVDTISTSLQHTAHLKFAYGTYQKNKFTASIGMIELNQFKLQDQQWGHRYIMKTLQDEYGFCSSADLGAKVDYKFSNWFSADVTVRNGEGFKKVQTDNIYWYGLGVTIQPFKSLYYRVYFDYSKKDVTQLNITNYISYIGTKFKVGAELELGQNFGNVVHKKLNGLSLFTVYQLTPKFEIFGRYDRLSSNTLSGQTNSWNYDKDLSTAILGIQINPIKNISISLNGRYVIPENSDKTKKISVYTNIDFKF